MSYHNVEVVVTVVAFGSDFDDDEVDYSPKPLQEYLPGPWKTARLGSVRGAIFNEARDLA